MDSFLIWNTFVLDLEHTSGLRPVESREPVVRALEDWPVQLPDVVWRLLMSAGEVVRAEAGGLSLATPAVAREGSWIVVRLHAQTADANLQPQCLRLIDEMEGCRPSACPMNGLNDNVG